MFPLADLRGRVLGFGARAVRDQQRPKYVNTSENEIYRKGRQLFGIDRARPHAARTRRLIVVEGYTDVLALHQSGMRDSVATMGTAVTEEQLAAMGTAAGAGGTVFLALDADRSGREAMLRAAQGAEKRGLELRVVDLPEGSDPADLIAARGAEELERRLERALSVPRFEVQRLVAGADLATPEGKDRLVAEALPLLRDQPRGSATWRDLMGYLADRLDVTDAELEAYMDQLSAPTSGGPVMPAAAPAVRRPARPPSVDASARAERAFLTMCLSRPDLGREYLGRLEDDHFSSEGLRRVRDHVSSHFEDPLAELPEDDPAQAALIKEVVMPSGDDEPSAEAMRLQFLLLEQHRVQRRLRRADREQDFERQVALARAQQSLRAEFDELMGQVS
jgi:DNA primase